MGAGLLQATFGKLTVVDLAGSERVKRSGVTGQGLKEAANINTSLLAFGNVVQVRLIVCTVPTPCMRIHDVHDCMLCPCSPCTFAFVAHSRKRRAVFVFRLSTFHHR
jgi:hypothetical protein